MSGQALRSLFVVALPRSLSSMIYQAARVSLGLEEPSWTSEGEFLNADRFALIPGPNEHLSIKFTTESSERALFRKITAFLDQVVVSHGFAYKDVIQPFIVSEWLKKNRVPVLKLKRNLADVAYSMLEHKWHYPARLFPRTEPVELAVVKGLLKAQEALDSIPGVEVDFDQLISDEEVLRSALASLYGKDVRIKSPKYIDREFRDRRSEIIERRSSPQYAAILDYLQRSNDSPLRRWF
jgi:hypothetical protein